MEWSVRSFCRFRLFEHVYHPNKGGLVLQERIPSKDEGGSTLKQAITSVKNMYSTWSQSPAISSTLDEISSLLSRTLFSFSQSTREFSSSFRVFTKQGCCKAAYWQIYSHFGPFFDFMSVWAKKDISLMLWKASYRITINLAIIFFVF